MKKAHSYYSLSELVERWEEEYQVNELDLLKWGADRKRKLQFSIFIGSKTKQINYSTDIVVLGLDETDGTHEQYSTEICKTKYPNDTVIMDVSSDTIQRIVLQETLYCISNKASEVDMRLIFVCEEPSCQFPDEKDKRCYFDFEIPLITCNRFDLIVTHKNALAFKKDFLDKEQEEILPQYLDPDNEFYSVTLDLAVRAWKAIFEDKKHLDKSSAGFAGAAYLQEPESGYDELLQKSGIKLTPKLAKNIATVAAGEYSPNKQKWNTFRKLRK